MKALEKYKAPPEIKSYMIYFSFHWFFVIVIFAERNFNLYPLTSCRMVGTTRQRIKDLLRIISQMCITLEKTRLFASPCFLVSLLLLLLLFFLCLYVESTVSLVLYKAFSGNLQKVLGNWEWVKPVKLQCLGTYCLSKLEMLFSCCVSVTNLGTSKGS